MNHTTKKFARSMDEAFPKGVDYGCAIKRYDRHEKILDVVVASAIGIALAALLVWGWSI